MYYSNEKPVLKQDYTGTYWNKDKTIGFIENKSDRAWKIINSTGTVIKEGDDSLGRRDAFEEVMQVVPMMVSYIDQKGRNDDMSIKYKPAHFVKGTLVRVCLLANIERSYTVESVICNGPGSYVIDTGIPHPSIDGITVAFNISYVKEIIRRPAERKASKVTRYEGIPQSRKPMPYYEFEQLIPKISSRTTDAGYRFLDECKLLKRLGQMGLIVGRVSFDELNGHFITSLVITDPRKALKFIQKNPHWALMTAKETKKINTRQLQAIYEVDDY